MSTKNLSIWYKTKWQNNKISDQTIIFSKGRFSKLKMTVTRPRKINVAYPLSAISTEVQQLELSQNQTWDINRYRTRLNHTPNWLI